MGKIALDKFDREILKIVQRNCQLKSEAIAEIVGLSSSAVQRRLARLRSEGTILKEVAVVQPRSMNNLMTFVTSFEVERENYAAYAQFQNWAQTQPCIQQVYLVTGIADMMAIILAEDVTQYEQIIGDILARETWVKRLTTNVVVRTLKLGLEVPIDAA